MQRQFVECDTLCCQGLMAAQDQLTKYDPKKVRATTGQLMWCEGKNGFLPPPILHNIYIGVEFQDINLAPFATWKDRINPFNLWFASFLKKQKASSGFRFSSAEIPTQQSVEVQIPILKKINIGQEADTNVHKMKYKCWREDPNRSKELILFGLSRGTAATFCAFAQEKYPEVKLVILEGAIDSVDNIIESQSKKVFSNETVRTTATNLVHSGLSLFTSYKKNGLSPLSCVDLYPENIPTVFITSKKDQVVPCENTTRIAQTLANKGKNDVYLIVLEESTHAYYAFECDSDRKKYLCGIHAIYKRYGIHHEAELATEGEKFIQDCLLQPANRIANKP